MDNPDKTTPSGTPKKPSLWKTKRKEILLGSAIAIGLVFLGAWGIRALMPGHEAVKQTAAARPFFNGWPYCPFDHGNKPFAARRFCVY